LLFNATIQACLCFAKNRIKETSDFFYLVMLINRTFTTSID